MPRLYDMDRIATQLLQRPGSGKLREIGKFLLKAASRGRERDAKPAGLAELRPGQVVLVRFGRGDKGLMAAEIYPDIGTLPVSH